MASTVGTNKVASNFYWAIFDHDPGSTSATVCTPDGGTTLRYVDLADYNHFAVLAMSSTLTGNGITKLEIVACADTTFGSVTAVKDSSTVAADAVGDFVFEECSAEEVVQLGATLRYVAARITMQNAADEAVVSYLAFPKFAVDGLTADTIAA